MERIAARRGWLSCLSARRPSQGTPGSSTCGSTTSRRCLRRASYARLLVFPFATGNRTRRVPKFRGHYIGLRWTRSLLDPVQTEYDLARSLKTIAGSERSHSCPPGRSALADLKRTQSMELTNSVRGQGPHVCVGAESSGPDEARSPAATDSHVGPFFQRNRTPLGGVQIFRRSDASTFTH